MKLFNITDIFNNIVTMSPATLEAFHDSLRDHYKELIQDGDLDNLRVLRNRMQVILEKNAQKFSEKELAKIKKIEKLFKKINTSIEKMESVIHEDEELVDVVKEIEEKYKPRKSLPEKKKDTHVLVCKKKETIEYEKELIQLQIELAKLQKYIIKNGKKLLIIFEGRDAAGK